MIQTVNNAMLLLDEIQKKGKITVNDAVDILKVDRSNAYRLLKTMMSAGYLSLCQNSYCVGYKLDMLNDMDISPIKMKLIAEPIMKSVAYSVGEIVHLCVRISNGMLSVHQVIATDNIQYIRKLGSVEPFYCTASGRAVLAYLPKEYQTILLKGEELKPFTEYTKTDFNELMNLLDEAKKQGYAEEVSEFHSGVQCISVPIFSGKSWPRYAIGISFTSHKDYIERKARIIAILKVASRQIVEACTECSKGSPSIIVDNGEDGLSD